MLAAGCFFSWSATDFFCLFTAPLVLTFSFYIAKLRLYVLVEHQLKEGK